MDEHLKDNDMEGKQENKFSLAQDLREEQSNDACEGLTLKTKNIDECSLKETQLYKLCLEQGLEDLDEKRTNEICQGQGLEDKRSDEHCIGDHCQGQDAKEKQVNVPQVNSGMETQELDDTSNNECRRQVMSQEKQLGDETLESQMMLSYDHSKVAEEEIADVAQEPKGKEMNECCEAAIDNNGSKSGSFCFGRTMGGKPLQTFLNDRVKEHESTGDQVNFILKSSKDPARLVLDLLDGFFPPLIYRGGNVAFELSVVRSSCLLLLEQLMNVKPAISKALQEEAIAVAYEWRLKMKREGESDVLVLGLLLLVAIFDPSSWFFCHDLNKLYERIDQHRLAPQLCQLAK